MTLSSFNYEECTSYSKELKEFGHYYEAGLIDELLKEIERLNAELNTAYKAMDEYNEQTQVLISKLENYG